MQTELIYLDNAATSYPKPDVVVRAVEHTIKEVGGNPGRSGHRLAIAANKVVFRSRETLADFFGIRESSRLIFTSGATESLNLAIKGIVREGDHVITSSIEHNSVTRPLCSLEKRGVEVTRLPCSASGYIDPDDVAAAIRLNTALMVLTHASNVIGTIEPVGEVASIAREKGIPFLVDACQTAGTIPINMEALNIDLFAASGHKGLLGPQGTGILYVAPDMDPLPLIEGGTGTGPYDDFQPEVLPDRYEPGTLNTPGIAGLAAGVEWIEGEDLLNVRKKEISLLQRLIDGLGDIEGVELYGTRKAEKRASLICFNVGDLDPAMVSYRLDEDYGIMSRSGLHCAPDAHKVLGTFPAGSVRLSPGYLNSMDDIDAAVDAVRRIAKGD